MIRPLTPELAKKARVELNEDPNRLQEDLHHLKDWIAKQPHLRARTDDQWLVAFLRGCKHSLEKTKKKIDLYYSSRTAAADYFTVKHTDPVFDQVISDGGYIVLPKTVGADGPRVVFGRMRRVDLNKYTIVDTTGTFNMLEKILFLEDDNLMVAGGVIVLDCEGMTISHIMQMPPKYLKIMSVIGQDASPIRMKGLHILNAPPGAEFLFNLMKSFVNGKNKDRFYMHSSLEELFKYFPKDIFPVDYGGSGSTTEEIVDYWKNKAKEYRTFFDEEANYGTDEHKRPGKPMTAEEMFGAEGSFRKLEID